MPTIWTPIGALVFRGYTTAERNALTAQERMVLFDSDLGYFVIYADGDWQSYSEYIGTIGASEHEEITVGGLHPEYAHPQHPEVLTATWSIADGGRVVPIAGNPPVGEVIIQVKTTTGAPVHSASRGTFCLVFPDATYYLNMVGGTAWVRCGTFADITAAITTHEAGDPHSLYLTQAEADALYAALSHALGTAHVADTLANLNAKVSDATLDDSSSSRPPSGAAGGDLGGTYPNPTVDDGADATAIHDNVASEISAVTEKASPVNADLLLIEDSAAGNAKKRVQVGNLVGNLPGGNGGDAILPLFTRAGTVPSSGTDIEDNYFEAPYDFAATHILATVDGAPSGASLVLLVYEGVTLRGTLTVADGNNSVLTDITNFTINSGDNLQLDISSSNGTATNLRVWAVSK
jgi:hypothetical protein